MGQKRKLTVYKKFRSRKWDFMSVPEIRLEGKWLEDLGFKEGEQIQVIQKYQKLIITVHQVKEELQ